MDNQKTPKDIYYDLCDKYIETMDRGDIVEMAMIEYAEQQVKLFAIPAVVGQSEQLKPKKQICYKSNEPCKYDCSGLCKESC